MRSLFLAGASRVPGSVEGGEGKKVTRTSMGRRFLDGDDALDGIVGGSLVELVDFPL